MRRDIFQAIADPVRREIIDLLSDQPRTVSSVANKFNISRPAVSKHIKILNECGVITITQKGRERYCEINPHNLAEVADWIEPYRKLWENRLDNFEAYLDKLQTKNQDNTGEDDGIK